MIVAGIIERASKRVILFRFTHDGRRHLLYQTLNRRAIIRRRNADWLLEVGKHTGQAWQTKTSLYGLLRPALRDARRFVGVESR